MKDLHRWVKELEYPFLWDFPDVDSVYISYDGYPQVLLIYIYKENEYICIEVTGSNEIGDVFAKIVEVND